MMKLRHGSRILISSLFLALLKMIISLTIGSLGPLKNVEIFSQ